MTAVYVLAAVASFLTLTFLLTIITSPLLAVSNFFVAKKFEVERRSLALAPFFIHPYLGVLAGRRKITVAIILSQLAVIVCGFLPWRFTFFLAWLLFSFSLAWAVWYLPYVKKRYSVLTFLSPWLLPLVLVTLIKKEI